MMEFKEIQKQASRAADKQDLIDCIRNQTDLVCGIDIVREVCPDHCESFHIKKYSTLWKDILELVEAQLKKENEQTAENLKRWTR